MKGKTRSGGTARPGSKRIRSSRDGKGDHMFYALRLAMSDILQIGVRMAELSGAGISAAVINGRDVPGLDAMTEVAQKAISGISDNNPDIFQTAYQTTANNQGVVELESIYAGAVKSIIGIWDYVVRMICCKAATDAFFEAFGPAAVGATRSVRYKESRTRPSAHFVKAYHMAHLDLKAAIKNARGPDKMIYKLADERFDEVCVASITRAAEESWSSTHMCAAIQAIFKRIIMEDTEESTAEAAGRAANAIIRSMSGNPMAGMAEIILGDVVPKASYYNSRQRAHDAAVREIHKTCADMVVESVGMCAIEELYGALIGGAYRTTADKTFFRSHHRKALESACAFDPRTDLAGFTPGEEIPAHNNTRWWMNNVLRYLVDVDCVAAAKSKENAPLMRFYEYAYDIAYTSASNMLGLRR